MLLTGFVCAWVPSSAVGRIRSCPDNFEYVFLLADNPALSGALSAISSDWETGVACPGDPGLIWCNFTPGLDGHAYNGVPRMVTAARVARAAAISLRTFTAPDNAAPSLHAVDSAGATKLAPPAERSRLSLPVPTVWGAAQIVAATGAHATTVNSVGAGKQCSVLFTGFTIHLEATDPSRQDAGVRFRLPYSGKPGKVQVKNVLRGYVHKSAKGKVDLTLQLGGGSKKISLSPGKSTDDNFTEDLESQFIASTRALYDLRIGARATRPAKSSDPLIVTIDSLDVEAS
jgi:hypothetical protein